MEQDLIIHEDETGKQIPVICVIDKNDNPKAIAKKLKLVKLMFFPDYDDTGMDDMIIVGR